MMLICGWWVPMLPIRCSSGTTGDISLLRRPKRCVEFLWMRPVARGESVTALAISLCFALLAPLLYPLFTIHTEVLQILNGYHFWLVLMPLSAVLSYLLDGVFIGAARSRYMMHGMAISLGLVYLPAWLLLQGYGNHGLWLSFTLFNASRGLTLAWYYRRLTRSGKWLD